MAAVGPFSTTTKLAAESPPFNPRLGLMGGGGGGGSSSNSSLTPPHSRNSSRSRSASPFTGLHYGSGGGNSSNNQHHHQHHRSASSASSAAFSSANSNAVSKYTFQYQGQTLEIRNVWAENVEEEMAVIRQIVEKYNYVAMDTEFPGIVAKPVTEAYSPDYHYKSLKVNVDLLKIIQLGLSFADENGNFAPGCPCWQFNFAFDLEGDMFAQDSIDLLQKSGISFEDHARRGIDPVLFGELLMVSGLVLDDRVKWVSFHSGCTLPVGRSAIVALVMCGP
jgi:CAF1 family ribonuclease